jgi:hypothetical protein
MTHLEMSPLVPVGELHRKPLSECGAYHGRFVTAEPPTVGRRHHQHPG